MITVDVYIAANSLTREYRCDDTLPAGRIAEEIVAREGYLPDPEWNRGRLILGSRGLGGLLNPELTLQESGVKNGDLLLLI